MSLELRVEHLSFQYAGIGASDEPVLRDLSLTLYPGQATALVGPSGSGKTTLIQHFTGLLNPTHGRVLVDGIDLHSKKCSLSSLRRRIGLVFQFPESQLFEETVYRDVAFGPANLGLTEMEIDLRVHEAMALTGLDFDLFSQRSPFRLSEGEKRRVAIAGVLAMQPEMVVLDEPTAGLDPLGVQNMAEILRSLLAAETTPVFITHNMDLVAEVSQRVLVLHNGQILFDGTPRQLFDEQEVMDKARLERPNFLQAFKPYRANLPAVFQSAISFHQLQHLLQNHPLPR